MRDLSINNYYREDTKGGWGNLIAKREGFGENGDHGYFQFWLRYHDFSWLSGSIFKIMTFQSGGYSWTEMERVQAFIKSIGCKQCVPLRGRKSVLLSEYIKKFPLLFSALEEYLKNQPSCLGPSSKTRRSVCEWLFRDIGVRHFRDMQFAIEWMRTFHLKKNKKTTMKNTQSQNYSFNKIVLSHQNVRAISTHKSGD